MKTFKQYVNSDIRRSDKNYDIDQSIGGRLLDQALGRIVTDFEHDRIPNQKDVDQIKDSYKHYEPAIIYAIKNNRKIPNIFIERITSGYDDNVSLNYVLDHIKKYNKNKIKQILQRNPELLEYFI